MHDWRSEYDTLLQEFPRILDAAETEETATRDVDLYVTVARAAFARHASAGQWAAHHVAEVRDWRNGDYSDEALASYGVAGSRRYALIACAWLGSVLGLFQQGTVTEADALAAYALLPGFVAGDAFEILSQDLA